MWIHPDPVFTPRLGVNHYILGTVLDLKVKAEKGGVPALNESSGRARDHTIAIGVWMLWSATGCYSGNAVAWVSTQSWAGS